MQNIDDLKRIKLDVREDIKNGADPFKKIMEAVNKLKDGEALDLINRLSEITAFMDKDLEIHFKREEEALFPVLGNYIGVETGPINVMLIEHNNCRDLSAGFKVKINGYRSDKNYKALADAGNSLSRLLSEHEDKEDHILFNMAQMHLTQDEKHNIMEKILSIN